MILQIFLNTTCAFIRFHLLNFVQSDCLLRSLNSSTLRLYSLMTRISGSNLDLLRMFLFKAWIYVLFGVFVLNFSVKSNSWRFVLGFNIYSSISLWFFRCKLSSILNKSIWTRFNWRTFHSNIDRLFRIFINRALSSFLVLCSFSS